MSAIGQGAPRAYEASALKTENTRSGRNARTNESTDGLSEAWRNFIRYCQQLGHGEIECLKIQDGVPVMAEVVREKIRFSS
jgi:hypothetical protein